MDIFVNGEKQSVDGSPPTIGELLKLNKVDSPDTVSVQLNGRFVDKSTYGSVRVADKDQVDFLYFLGGGSEL
jgi:sulfur carrier protein